MTVTGLHAVTCPTCGQAAELLFRPGPQDYIMLTHNAIPMSLLKCATSGTVYSKEIVKVTFKQ